MSGKGDESHLCEAPSGPLRGKWDLSPFLAAVRRDLAGLATALLPTPSPRPGLHGYTVGPPGRAVLRRIHLRVEEDGRGLLLVDVTDAIHLNPTAALLSWLALEGFSESHAVQCLRRRYPRIGRDEIERGAAAVFRLIDHLRTPARGCPTCGLADLGRVPLFTAPVRAPYKADLALTYGCNNACAHCYNPAERRGMRPLGLDGWRAVLRRLAEAGVPHVIFTGGEPTLFAGLVDLVAEAARLGLVAGLNTNGRRLAKRPSAVTVRSAEARPEKGDKSNLPRSGPPGASHKLDSSPFSGRERSPFALSLAQAGLSHVQVTLESHRAEVHDAMTGAAAFQETVAGIRASVDAGLYTITNTTLTRRNIAEAEPLVDFLHDLGVTTFAANGMIYSGRGRCCGDAMPEEELAPVLVRLRDRAAELGMRFLWYTPTPYCRLSPVELELGPRRCNAGQYSVCVEPNGDVLPCQSYYRAAGNLLRDPWPAIWDSPLFRSFRDRAADPRGAGLPPECWDCPDLAVCGGGCRIEREAGIDSSREPMRREHGPDEGAFQHPSGPGGHGP